MPVVTRLRVGISGYAARAGRSSVFAPVCIGAIWVAVLVAMVAHPTFISDDSAESYAHVWYLARALFTLHEWPFHVALLANGQAIMFPYGWVPWVPDALLYPAFGNAAVTFSMALGVVLLVVSVLVYLPALREARLLALFLLNVQLWNSVTQFELPTIWALSLAFFGCAAAERRRWPLAIGLLALAIAAHPQVGTAAIGTIIICVTVHEHRLPRGLLACGAVAAVLASPSYWLLASGPVVGEANRVLLALSFLDNFRRLSIVLLAVVLAAYPAFFLRHFAKVAALGTAMTAVYLLLLPPSGLWESTRPQFSAYLQQHPISAQGSYRVLVKNNYKTGMIEFMKAGAVLSTELFPESIRRQSFPSVKSYACFLATSDVGDVVITGDYQRLYHTNELQLLDQLAEAGQATRDYVGPDGTLGFRIVLPSSDRRPSVRDCGL